MHDRYVAEHLFRNAVDAAPVFDDCGGGDSCFFAWQCLALERFPEAISDEYDVTVSSGGEFEWPGKVGGYKLVCAARQ